MATDWGLEIFKIAGTGVSVFIGAKLAWDNASKGRKEEVLVKERYKAFENVIGVLYEMEYHLYLLTGIFDITPIESGEFVSDDVFDEKLKLIDATDDFYVRMIKSRQYVMFNAESSVQNYTEIMSDLPSLKWTMEQYLNRISNSEELSSHVILMPRGESITFIHTMAEKLQNRTRKLINALFEEQGFPTTERPFRRMASTYTEPHNGRDRPLPDTVQELS